MPNIEIDFAKFMPSLGIFYSYFEILKVHQFIQDIEVVHQNGNDLLKIYKRIT
ncbi:MAG: hypothetical protein ACTSWC_10380 [Promethearchaeota archaeon]